MSRTTIDLDDGVLQALRDRSAQEQRSMGAVASELLAGALHDEGPPARPFRWVSRSMGARVDLEDRDALWAVLDGGQPDSGREAR